jgi:acyltransferase
MQPVSEEKRIWFIDIARFYAISLVFYGHFIERIMMLQNPAAAVSYKFIYSFHLVLFIILAGYISRESDVEFGFTKYLKHRFFSRLLPFLVFTAIFMVLPVFFAGDFFHLQLPSVEGYAGGLISTAFGLTLFCVPSWFILLIFSVEMVHYCAFRFLKSSNLRILAGILFFYVAGYWMNLQFDIVNPAKQKIIGWNYLFIHEAVVMYAFYLSGVYLRRKRFLMDTVPKKILIPGVIATFFIVLFTFQLNNGPFNFNYFNSVVIMFSAHGSFLWFPVTALAGSLFVLLLAKITPSQKTILLMGQNTLLLMCLNGIFYHYINFIVAKWVVDHLSDSFLTITGIGFLMTLTSLALCIPLIYLFNRFVPQLVGKPKTSGPWLKNFI